MTSEAPPDEITALRRDADRLRALRLERDRLDLILRSVPNPIIVIDTEDQIISMNVAAQRLFGERATIPATAVMSGRKAELSLRNSAKFASFIAQLRLVPGDRKTGELALVDPETEEDLEMAVTSTEIRDDAGVPVATVFVLQDVGRLRELERRRLGQQLRERVGELEAANTTISTLNADLQRRVDEATTELRAQYERLEELDRLKTQFMSVASHELKTPVTAMSGFLQVALRRIKKRLDAGHPNEKEWAIEQNAITEQLVIVQRQTTKLARLIDELLDVSRIQNGRVEFRLDEMDLAQLAREVAERMQTMTMTMMMMTTHTITVEDGRAVAIVADRDHIEQVLNNLIANAVKYSPDGGEITVRVGEEAGQASLSVTDSGIGIPQEELEAVFGLFYRSPDRRARDVGGMGLGLYISRGIVDRHGGRIWAVSEPGQGTTFQVRLPREAPLSQDVGARAPVATRA